MTTPEKVLAAVGRGLLALLFILAGLGKAASSAPALAHMAEFGLPAFLLPAVIALEIGAGVALLVGYKVRYSAGLLGLFCIVAAAIFHHQLDNPAERTMFFKDIALAGALIAMASTARITRTIGTKAHHAPNGNGAG